MLWAMPGLHLDRAVEGVREVGAGAWSVVMNALGGLRAGRRGAGLSSHCWDGWTMLSAVVASTAGRVKVHHPGAATST